MSSLKDNTQSLTPHNRIDAYTGQQLKIARRLNGMSQKFLGQQVGLTFQQILKYEKGHNRISAGRLYEFACLLKVPTSYFFPNPSENPTNQSKHQDPLPLSVNCASLDLSSQALDVAHMFDKIADPKLKKSLYHFVGALPQKKESDS